jgi:hypothetical protein
MSYQLTHVFVCAFGSVLCVVLREQQIVLVLFPKQQLKFDIVNVTLIYKDERTENLNE